MLLTYDETFEQFEHSNITSRLQLYTDFESLLFEPITPSSSSKSYPNNGGYDDNEFSKIYFHVIVIVWRSSFNDVPRLLYCDNSLWLCWPIEYVIPLPCCSKTLLWYVRPPRPWALIWFEQGLHIVVACNMHMRRKGQSKGSLWAPHTWTIKIVCGTNVVWVLIIFKYVRVLKENLDFIMWQVMLLELLISCSTVQRTNI